MGKSNIQWTEQTWNPIVGCSILTPGCTNCYAMKMARRIELMNEELVHQGKRGAAHYAGMTKVVKGRAVWTGKLALASEKLLLAPLRRRKPTTYFVNSMGDLFHEDAPDEWIDKVFAVMADTQRHTYQVLTKRAERMRAYLSNLDLEDRLTELWQGDNPDRKTWNVRLPLPNVWLGVSTERQQEADERIPLLLQTPAAVRFISAEPLIGPIDLSSWPDRCWLRTMGADGAAVRPGLDWVIVGGESGSLRDVRPVDLAWVRSIVEQCKESEVACFVKQIGSGTGFNFHHKKGGDPSEWAADLRVRQMPGAAR